MCILNVLRPGVNQHIRNSHCAQNCCKNHEYNWCDHAGNHWVTSGITEVSHYQKAGSWNADEPDKRNEAELVVISHDDIECREVLGIHFSVQAAVWVVIGQVAQTSAKCHIEQKDEASDFHHNVEHVFIGLPHQHRHMVLLHFLRDNNSRENHAYHHQQENVSLARQHEDRWEVVTDR